MLKTVPFIVAAFFIQTTYGQQVTLCADANYLGAFKTLGPGQYALSDFNDVTTSIKVPQGMLAYIYEHAAPDRGYGISVDLLEDVADLSVYNFNDKVSYIVVSYTTRDNNKYVWVRSAMKNGQFVSGHWERQRVQPLPYNPVAVVSPSMETPLTPTSTVASGTLVPGFGTGGLVTNADNASFSKIAVQPSGKIIVSRPSPAGGQLLRYNADGSQDLNFGPDARFTKGIVYVLYLQRRYDIEDLLIQPDGKIIVLATDTKFSGSTSVFRFNEDGSVDGKFGNSGRTIPDIAGFKYLRSITLEASGKIVVMGSYEHNANDRTSLLMAKFNADGTPDLSFNRSGIRIVVETDGKDYMGEMCRVDGSSAIIVLVKAGSDYYLRRYKPDGKIDPAFGTGGQMNFFPIVGLDVDAVGRIAYIRGATCYILNANGTNAASYDLPADASATEIIYQDDGKILLARLKKSSGKSNFWMERLNSNGTPDLSFGQNGEVLTSFGIASSITAVVIYNRRIYAAGFVQVAGQDQHGAIAVYGE